MRIHHILLSYKFLIHIVIQQVLVRWFILLNISVFCANASLISNSDPIYVFGPDQSTEQPGGMSAVYRAVEVDLFYSAAEFFYVTV